MQRIFLTVNLYLSFNIKEVVVVFVMQMYADTVACCVCRRVSPKGNNPRSETTRKGAFKK